MQESSGHDHAEARLVTRSTECAELEPLSDTRSRLATQTPVGAQGNAPIHAPVIEAGYRPRGRSLRSTRVFVDQGELNHIDPSLRPSAADAAQAACLHAAKDGM